MTTRVASLCLLAVLASVPAGAQTPTPGGGKATIDFLYNQLLVLQGRVAQLESRTDEQITETDLVGRYAISHLGIEMAENPYISTTASTVVLTLHADRSVTGQLQSGPLDGCTLKFAGSWKVTCEPFAPGQVAPTWRYENGFLIISEPGDEDAHFLLGADGRMFIGADTSNFLPGHSWSTIIVGMRLPNQ
jgi:hypothetical protein